MTSRAKKPLAVRLLAVVVLLISSGTLGGVNTAAAQTDAGAPNCSPGSGKNLSARHLTADDIQIQESLQCADLQGSSLNGLSLIQVDLSGADLQDADLEGADLTQATMTGANLSGANLMHAKLGQATLTNALLNGANLSDADLSQADLTGADLDDANVSGTDFTQATLSKVTVHGIKGLTPWSKYLLLGALALYVILALLTLRKAIQRFRNGSAARGVRTLGLGLFGSAVAAFGLHLFIGGMVGTISKSGGGLVEKACTGATCSVGLTSGVVGLAIGVLAAIAGFGLRAAA